MFIELVYAFCMNQTDSFDCREKLFKCANVYVVNAPYQVTEKDLFDKCRKIEFKNTKVAL